MTTNTQPLILIVDDNPRNLRLLGNVLVKNGYDPAACLSGKEALAYLQKKTPDLIFLDIMMPEMDGYEVCTVLKKEVETRDIPVIFLTAKVEVDDIIKGFNCGGVDYVTKPFNPVELIARMKTHPELKRSREVIVEQDHEKKELIHLLCHDLTNPLASIKSGFRHSTRNWKSG